MLSHFGIVGLFPVPIHFSPIELKKKKNVIIVDFWGAEGRLPVFAFLLVCVFTWAKRKIPSPEDDSSYEFTVLIPLL